MILELAEAPSLYDRIKAGEELIESEDAVLFFGSGRDPRSCSVQRLRVPDEGVRPVVDRVRSLVKARGREGVVWEVVTPVHPPSRVFELRALGMQPSTPPSAVIMSLGEPPQVSAPDVVVTSVDTIAEYEVHVRVTHEVFGMRDRLPASVAQIQADGERDLADRRFVRYVARVDGEPAGAGTATFGPMGAMLHTGSTLERFRNRGVYSAMVAHRFAEAAARGTPQVVTRAGEMSRPVLEKLGFREIGRVHFIVDRIAAF